MFNRKHAIFIIKRIIDYFLSNQKKRIIWIYLYINLERLKYKLNWISNSFFTNGIYLILSSVTRMNFLEFDYNINMVDPACTCRF